MISRFLFFISIVCMNFSFISAQENGTADTIVTDSTESTIVENTDTITDDASAQSKDLKQVVSEETPPQSFHQILKTKYNSKEVYFLPRHGKGHFVSPSNINFRANIDALKQLGVTDIVSVSAVGSLKENLPPGKFVIIDQFIDRTFARNKTFFDDEIVAHVSMAHPTSNGLMNACEDAIKKSNIDY